jgi:hypothetical protein
VHVSPQVLAGIPHTWLRLPFGFPFRDGFLNSRYHFVDAVAVSRFRQNVAQRRQQKRVRGSGFSKATWGFRISLPLIVPARRDYSMRRSGFPCPRHHAARWPRALAGEFTKRRVGAADMRVSRRLPRFHDPFREILEVARHAPIDIHGPKPRPAVEKSRLRKEGGAANPPSPNERHTTA